MGRHLGRHSRVPHQVENLETPTVAVAFNFVEPRNVDVFLSGAEELGALLPSFRGWRAYREIATVAAALASEYGNDRENCVNDQPILSLVEGVTMDVYRTQVTCGVKPK